MCNPLDYVNISINTSMLKALRTAQSVSRVWYLRGLSAWGRWQSPEVQLAVVWTSQCQNGPALMVWMFWNFDHQYLLCWMPQQQVHKSTQGFLNENWISEQHWGWFRLEICGFDVQHNHWEFGPDRTLVHHTCHESQATTPFCCLFGP